MKPSEILQERVKRLRGFLGMTQGDLAALVDGWDRPTVAKIEGGYRNVSVNELVTLAKVFDIDMRALVGLLPLTVTVDLDGAA